MDRYDLEDKLIKAEIVQRCCYGLAAVFVACGVLLAALKL